MVFLGLALAALGLACVGESAVAQAQDPEAPVVAQGVRAITPGGAELRAGSATLGPDGAQALDVEVQVPGELPLSVRADRAVWDMKTQGLRLEGSVVATRGPFELRCASLELVVGEDGQVQRAIARGGVDLRRETWTAKGSSAELTLATGALVLTGSAQVSDGRNQLRGERVLLHLNDERVECERCELVLPDPLPKATQGGP